MLSCNNDPRKKKELIINGLKHQASAKRIAIAKPIDQECRKNHRCNNEGIFDSLILLHAQCSFDKLPNIQESNKIRRNEQFHNQMIETKFPNIENFENQQLLLMIRDYKSIQKSDDTFFTHRDLTIRYLDVDILMERKITSQSIWLFLLDFLVAYSYQFHHRVPLFKFFYVKNVDIEKLSIDFAELTQEIDQEDQPDEKQVILVKLLNQYFLIILHEKETIIVDYSFLKEEKLRFLTSQFLKKKAQKIKLIQSMIAKDSSHFLFYFLCLFLSGHKISSISLTQYDEKVTYNRQLWLILQYGFNYIEEIYQNQLEEQEDQKQQAIIEIKKQKLNSEIKKKRRLQIEEKKNLYRLNTPRDSEEIEKQKQYMKERIAYLSVLNGDLNEDNILMSEMFQLRQKALNQKIDEEFLIMDALKQSSINYASSNSQLLRNASQILNGKFNENLFKGLGLNPPESFEKEALLKSLKDKNYSDVIEPIIGNKRVVPGLFIPQEKVKNLIVSRYGVQIFRQDLQDFRSGSISTNIINYYLGFLEEFCILINEKSKFMPIEAFQDIMAEVKGGRVVNKQLYEFSYLSDYDRIYFPIKAGDFNEYSLAAIDTINLKIHHFYMMGEKKSISPNQLQQLYQYWKIDGREQIEQNISRQELQERILKYLIFWIKRQCQIFQIQHNNMRLWKIRIQDIDYVERPADTGYYLLTILSLIVVKRQKTDDKSFLPIIKDIVEHTLCSERKHASDKTAFKYFEQRLIMNNTYKS